MEIPEERLLVTGKNGTIGIERNHDRQRHGFSLPDSSASL
jgi:hypothetical protein